MSTMSTAGHWEPMTSPQLENAQLFQLAESHQAVILHPTAPFERFLMKIDQTEVFMNMEFQKNTQV